MIAVAVFVPQSAAAKRERCSSVSSRMDRNFRLLVVARTGMKKTPYVEECIRYDYEP